MIIGAGSSGCVLANRLSEDPAIHVLLLEAGEPDTKREIHEASQFPSLWRTEVDWNYTTQEEPNLLNRKITWPRGKVLGGSSAINAMIYIRGHHSDYDHWASLGNKGWSYKEVLPYFIKSEDNQLGASAYHGSGGPLHVSGKACSQGICYPFVEGAMELGYKGPDWDFNGVQQENGAGFYQYTAREGKRQSAAVAFLKPVLSRPNLTVQTFAQVSRLLFSGKRVTGVEYLQGGKLQEVRILKEVILSAGAIESPKILMLSGIGPADSLRRFKINVVADLPGVGQNLQDHLASQVFVPSNLPAPLYPLPHCSGLFVRSKYAADSAAPDLQFMVYHMPTGDDKTSFMCLPILSTPQSRGSLALQSATMADAPLIRANYLHQEADLQVLTEGFKLLQEIIETAAFQKQRTNKEPLFNSQSDITTYIRKTAGTLYHPVGTCKMGRDAMAVVKPDLTVHGIEALRVVDASIMPTLINANTNATCMMIGEYASDIIRNQRR